MGVKRERGSQFYSVFNKRRNTEIIIRIHNHHCGPEEDEGHGEQHNSKDKPAQATPPKTEDI
jgi:hypothetical protein